MLYVFFAFYFALALLLQHWGERNVYIFSLLYARNSVDVYTTTFFFLLGLVSAAVCIWSYFYIDGETAYSRFMQMLLAFIISIIILIFVSNLFIALIGWDGLGVTSFLLVIYYKNRKCLGSGIITAITNRLGDCLLICCLGFSLMTGSVTLLVIMIILSMTKRAQFPFSSWLPAAIAAPTPVRALVHSSTLVTAGVYFLIRFCPSDPSVLLNLGSFTMLLAGLSACVERDLKKVVALSTLSQLGVMIISLGASEKSYCFFHLISHAYFKALLFICVGALIHSVYGTQDYRRFNRLSTTLFVSVFATVSNLSLIGFFFMSGFYRKDGILEAMECGEIGSSYIALFLIGIGLTARYSLKMLFWTILLNSFSGSSAEAQGGFVWSVKIPLLVLGSFSIAFGVKIRVFCSPLRLVLGFSDKVLPLALILTGGWLGYLSYKFKNNTFRSIITLVPASQNTASFIATTGVIQKTIDNGWVRAGTMIFTTFSSSILSHYSAIIALGLCVLILFFFYGKYCLHDSNVDDGLRWRHFDQ